MNILDYKFVLHTVGGHDLAFEAANQDLTDSTYQYFGFISSFGSWVVMRFNIIGSTIIYTYNAGKTRSDYDAFWNGTTGRYIPGSETFTTFDQIITQLE